MTTIYLNRHGNNGHHDDVIPLSEITSETTLAQIKTSSPPINIYVDVQPSYFEIKLWYNTTETIPGVPDPETGVKSEDTVITHTKYLVWQKLDLSTLKEEGNAFVDQTRWSVHDETVKVDFNGETHEPMARVLGRWDLVDVFANTFNSKKKKSRESSEYLSTWSFFVPFIKDCSMTDFTYRLVLDRDLTYVIDPTSPSKDMIVDEPQADSIIAPITITPPATLSADSVAVVGVETSVPQIESIWIEPVVGQVDRTKVSLTNGSGSFKIITTGLTAGETVEVKVGYKKWTNVIKYTQTIS